MADNGENKGRFVKGDARAGRPLGSVNKSTAEVKEVARDLVDDPEYRDILRTRLKSGECSPAVESMLWYYAYGKPKEQLEISGSAVNIDIVPAPTA